MQPGDRCYLRGKGPHGVAAVPARVVGVYRRACGGTLLEIVPFGGKPRACVPGEVFTTPTAALKAA
jgi:hypothetical protein